MKFRYSIITLAIAFLILLPVLVNNGFFISVFVTILVFSILASSLNLMMGYAGLTSVAHGALFGIGAYCTGLLVTRLNFSYWVALPLATFLTALALLAVGLPALRTRGVYFIIVTIAFQIIVTEFLQSTTTLTGGETGLNLPVTIVDSINLGPVGQISFSDARIYYYFVLLVTLFYHYFMLRLVNSPFGLAIVAIRENENQAKALALDTTKYKALVIFVSGAMAGTAGGIYAPFFGYVSPSFFDLFTSTNIFLMVMLGGSGIFLGGPVGSFIVILLQELLRDVSAVRDILFGALIVILMLFLPHGLVSYFTRIRLRLQTAPNPKKKLT